MTTKKYQVQEQDSFDIKPSIIAPTTISKLQLDNSFWNYLYSLLKNETPYNNILIDLEDGKTQVVRKGAVFKRMNKILVVYLHNRDAE